MVYFECDTCIATLKKKQVLIHYQNVCRNAHSFSCLACHKHFDRETIVAHTSCVTEEEKYTKGDIQAQNKRKQILNLNNIKDNIDELDFSKFEWKGFTKTAKNILKEISVRKIKIERLVKEMGDIYARYKDVEIDDVDCELLKKTLMDKIEDSDSFVIDLGKNLIKLKM